MKLVLPAQFRLKTVVIVQWATLHQLYLDSVRPIVRKDFIMIPVN